MLVRLRGAIVFRLILLFIVNLDFCVAKAIRVMVAVVVVVVVFVTVVIE